MIAKYDADPDDFYYDVPLNATAVASLPQTQTKRIVWSQRNFFYLYLCIGDEAKRILKARKQAVKVKTQKYPMLMDALAEFFERLRNVIHESGLFYVRKQRENETFENFYAELTTVVGRCV